MPKVIVSQLEINHAPWECRVAGCSSLLLKAKSPQGKDEELLCHALVIDWFKQHPEFHIVEVIPSFHSLLLEFDLRLTDHRQLAKALRQHSEQLSKIFTARGKPQQIEIPVYYATETGPDLALITQKTGLSVEKIIHYHSASSYRVRALGFAPGFAYMTQLAKPIRTRRLTEPKTNIPAGSVAIAEAQTTVYPVTSRGNWLIIGRTPTTIFDKQAESPCLLTQGDIVTFRPMTRADYLAAGGIVNEQ